MAGEQPLPPVLDYRTPSPARAPSPIIAVAFCLPNLLEWAGLIVGVTRFHLHSNWFLMPAVVVLWVTAMLTTIGSVSWFVGERKTWYVVLCLGINMISLVSVTALPLYFIILEMAA